MSSLQLAIDEDWGIVETVSEKKKTYGYRFYPDKVKGEGFFIAALKKLQGLSYKGKHADGRTQKKNEKSKSNQVTAKEIEVLKLYVHDVHDFFFIKQNEEVIAMPQHLENDLAIIQSSLYIKKAGVKLGTLIRNELIPAHELAVSNIINPAINCLEVDLETALQYLRKQEIKIDSGLKGWVLLSYQHLSIGWIKIIGHRINNYYSAAWRILNK